MTLLFIRSYLLPLIWWYLLGTGTTTVTSETHRSCRVGHTDSYCWARELSNSLYSVCTHFLAVSENLIYLLYYRDRPMWSPSWPFLIYNINNIKCWQHLCVLAHLTQATASSQKDFLTWNPLRTAPNSNSHDNMRSNMLVDRRARTFNCKSASIPLICKIS